jgi:hypothetical protein
MLWYHVTHTTIYRLGGVHTGTYFFASSTYRYIPFFFTSMYRYVLSTYLRQKLCTLGEKYVPGTYFQSHVPHREPCQTRYRVHWYPILVCILWYWTRYRVRFQVCRTQPIIWNLALYDIIYDIISIWYYLWYHTSGSVYDIIELWYHRSMISYFLALWYQLLMIS